MFRNIPTITKNLLIINIIIFLASLVLSGQFNLTEFGRLHFFLAPDFHFYQLITYQFLHADITHIFFNMFALWMFGCVIERVWGPQKFLFYYLVCGIGAGLCQELVQYIEYSSGELSQLSMNDIIPVQTGHGVIQMSVASYLSTWGTIGASGAVYGILLAFGMTFPNERIFIFPLPVPIKAKWFICIYAALELFMAYQSSGDGVAHVAHLGGMLFGLLLILYWRRHPGSLNMNSGRQYFENMKRSFEARKGNQQQTARTQQTNTRQAGYGPTRQDDMEYNAEKQRRQAEVDAILDKIRKSGYDSLTKEEKQRLFEASRER
ncbi:MAG: rhomboid family intramembrane serine protease [Prevotella sp.]|nr:rhomboid family intramembrane serine protease [Prevotella sp.]